MATKNDYYLSADEDINLTKEDHKKIRKKGGYKFIYEHDWNGRPKKYIKLTRKK